LEAEVRSGLIVIGVLSLVLACAAIPMPLEANDALVVLLLWPYAQWCVAFLPFGRLTLNALKRVHFPQAPETLGEHLLRRVAANSGSNRKKLLSKCG
jgi:hypothetical protein